MGKSSRFFHMKHPVNTLAANFPVKRIPADRHHPGAGPAHYPVMPDFRNHALPCFCQSKQMRPRFCQLFRPFVRLVLCDDHFNTKRKETQ